ncbi:MAG: matrixin family metalloprotease [Bryobacteraceae bacterium]|nr:matrixin family metalloprotease [Bryobacteraceae bacterium]
MRLLSLPLMGLLACSLWASRSGDLREHTRTASSIVIGEVTANRSYFGTDGEIYTDVTIQVNSSLKESNRKSSRSRSFTVKGGTVGDTTVMFTDIPTFEMSERVILFLENDAATEKYTIRGGYVPELDSSATKVLETMDETLRDLEQPILESERQRARTFLSEFATGAPAPDAACYVLIGPKWTENAATFKIGATIPAEWNAALSAAAATWGQAGTVFNFRADPASANELLIGPVSSSNALATTRIEWDSTNRIRKFSMTFNANYSWGTNGDAGKFDVESVTAHELGHALGLTHPGASECAEQTMWASAGAGELKKRTLEGGDKAGLAVLYPAGAPTTPPPPPPPPPPVTTVPAPTLTGAFFFPSLPRAGQAFQIWLTGNGLSATTSQIVINGPSCPSACVLSPSFRSTTLAGVNTTLSTKGAHTVAVRNGATGTASATRALNIQ